ncbi:MAG: hypothetical protein KJZ92_06180 [Rhodocyclaceae bacterium]|jgi:uncharacterized protein|nr:hypothetical protein [Zoogloeaceae bacterium]MBP9653127.1 hypothetical protein [Rhodocyclaceae bacterium]MCZ2175591.1 hypothetical protein [Burkholderiales bacterium]OQY73831.1 MAG: hypothetical protein B6D47_03215 [Rhodocyclaceae bacterium UTPRO2]HNQ56667.1 PP0621 family protein [Candidatus Desulfobacillus denitrificans]
MSKLILLLFLGLLAYLAFKGFQRHATPRRRQEHGGRAAERMVVCARCGVHLPESEAIDGDGGRFCCEEHRRLGPA